MTTGLPTAADAPAPAASPALMLDALDASLDAFWILEAVRDPDGAVTDFRVAYLNRRAAETAGVGRGEGTGALMADLVPTAHRLGHVAAYAEVVRTGLPARMEFRYDPPGGAPVWREAQAVRVGDGVVLTIRDVTLRVITEAARADADRDFRLLAENATDVISRITPDGVAAYVSPACREVLALDPGEIVGRPAAGVLHPAGDGGIASLRARLATEDVVRSPAYRFRRGDGSWVWLESVCRAVRDGAGALAEVQASTRDVSERASAEAEHAALNRVSEAVAEGLSGPALHAMVAVEVARLLGADGGRVVAYLGDDEAEVLGAWRRDGLPPAAPGTRMRMQHTWAIAETARTGAPGVSELTEVDADVAGAGLRVGLAAPVRLGSELWGAVAAAFAEPTQVPPGALERVERFAKLVGLAVANADARERLTAQATTDALTGLANHGAFHAALADAFALAERHGRPLSLALIDLDHFRSVNGTLGHRGGDDALRTVAAALRAHSRRSDVVGRVGGEEIAWLMPETSVADAVLAADRLRAAVAAAPVGGPLGLTVSIGVAGRQAGAGPDGLFRRADAALYSAKDLGRDRIHTA